MSHNTELISRSAVELRRMIGSKEISPVELLDACIERIEAINPAVNAVTATCYPEARIAAKTAERQVLNGEPLGLLHGLPLGVKDLKDTAGLLTTYGSPMSRGNVPSRDVLLVERLRVQRVRSSSRRLMFRNSARVRTHAIRSGAQPAPPSIPS